VAVERPTVSAGIGISLAGHKDRNKMAVLVCGIRPSGAAARLGPDAVCVGDEILEVSTHFFLPEEGFQAPRGVIKLPFPVVKGYRLNGDHSEEVVYMSE